MSAKYAITSVKTGKYLRTGTEGRIEWVRSPQFYPSYDLAYNALLKYSKLSRAKLQLYVLGAPGEVWVLRNVRSHLYCGYVQGKGYVELSTPFECYGAKALAATRLEELSIFRPEALYLDTVCRDSVIDISYGTELFDVIPENDAPKLETLLAWYPRDCVSRDFVIQNDEVYTFQRVPDLRLGKSYRMEVVDEIERLISLYTNRSYVPSCVTAIKVWTVTGSFHGETVSRRTYSEDEALRYVQDLCLDSSSLAWVWEIVSIKDYP